MTRINAGSTLANQYAPPFVVSDSVTTNWQLRYNLNLLAFEAFDPSENVVSAGFDTIESQLFSGVTNQQIFVLPWVVATEQSLIVTINGVKQHTPVFIISAGISTTTVTFDAPATGDIEFIGLQTTGGATIQLFNAVGDGSTTDFLIGYLAPSEQSMIVTINGIKQHTDEYSIASNSLFTDTTISFDSAPANLAAIEIIGITTTGEVPASPVDGSNLTADSGTVKGLFANKTVAGENQVLNFKALAQGTNITLVDGTTFVTVNAVVPTFNNIGTGIPIAPTPGTTDPLDIRVLDSVNRIILTVISDAITISYDTGYIATGSTPHNTAASTRLLGITNTGAPFTVNLSAIANLPAGDTITIKDQTGGAATNNITITTAAAETIDGAATHVINTNFGHVTLYSDGTNYFIISGG